MLLPSEIESRTTIPTLRAMVARRLSKVHGLGQMESAKLLSVTQAAISNYLRGTRGATTNWEEVEQLRIYADEISEMLVGKSDEVAIMNKFNEALFFARRNRFLCGIHQRLEPNFNVNNCHICEI